MAKLKDGYFKNIGSAEGNDSYALLAGGGHLGYSNSGGANALVQRDANGYIVNNYFNTTGGGSEKNASGLGYIAGFNASDYYIRSYTSAAVKSWLGLGSNAYTSTAYLPLTGGTITGNLMVRGTDGISSSSSIHLGIGDSDTGFKWISDGKVQMMADNVAIGEWTPSGMNWLAAPKVNNNVIWHSGNDGAGSGLDAGLLCGRSAELYFKTRVGYMANINDQSLSVDNSTCHWTPDTIGRPSGSLYGVLMNISDNTPWYNQFGFATNNNIYFRQSINSATNFGAWKTLAFTDSNVASATYSPNSSKLYSTDETYRYSSNNPYYGYLTYNGTLNVWDFKVSPNTPENVRTHMSDRLTTSRSIWGQSFNGTGNVSGVLTLPLNDQVQWADSGGAMIYGTSSKKIIIDASVGIGATSPAYNLDVAGTLRATGAVSLSSTLNVAGVATFNSVSSSVMR